MKVILPLLFVTMLLAGSLQPALAEEAEVSDESEATPPPIMLQTTPLEACPIEACPAEGAEEGILPVKPKQIPPSRIQTAPTEIDHPLYLIAVMLYPVGWLAKTVIVNPILFVFDHPFSKSPYECPPPAHLQTYGSDAGGY
jgi:hypothetical protein